MKAIIILVTSFTLFSSFVYASDQYLCAVDKSTGFRFDEESKEWRHTEFKADSKYVISKPASESPWVGTQAFLVRQIGGSFPVAFCEKDFTEPGFLSCNLMGRIFEFNRISGRFTTANTFGYHNVVPGVNDLTDENAGTPFISIGKCSPF